MADPKFRPESEETFGIGMKADGTLNVLTPEQYQKALLERRASEALDDEDPELNQQEDFSDLKGDDDAAQ
jgi:hypothetical protein